MRRTLSPVATRAAGALVVRRAVAPLILYGLVDTAAWARASVVSDDAWRLFLGVERCAAPLRRALGRAPSAAPPDAPFHAMLARMAQRETSRILVVRTQLRTAAAIAAAQGASVLVLKGGVLAASDEAIDLTDLDVLVAPDRSSAFAAALEAAGWADAEQTTQRVARSLVAHDVTLEIHHALDEAPTAWDDGIWARSVVLDAMPPLRQLGPGDTLRHIVQHVARAHPNRRVRLRDLLLIAHAARRCPASEVASMYAGAGADYVDRMCRATLDLAVRPASGIDNAEVDRHAITGYVLRSRPPLRFLSAEINEFVDYWSVSMLQSPWERRQIWSEVRAKAEGPSSRPYIRAIEQRSETLGRAWRVTARAAYRAVTWVMGGAVAAYTSRTVAQALRSPALAASTSARERRPIAEAMAAGDLIVSGKQGDSGKSAGPVSSVAPASPRK